MKSAGENVGCFIPSHTHTDSLQLSFITFKLWSQALRASCEFQILDYNNNNHE